MIKRIGKTDVLHRGVIYNGVGYFAGITADAGFSSVYEQAANIFEKADKLFDAAGTSKEQLLSTQIFLKDLGAKEEMNRAWKEWLPADYLSARATIGNADLGAGVLIEIVFTAAVS